MNSHDKPRRRSCGANIHGARGFTLIEAVASTVVVSLTLAASLQAIQSVHMMRDAATRQARGQLLAEDLIAEIVNQEFEDPDNPGSTGIETGEAGGTRENFDDMDDYHNWNPSQPEDAAGNPLPGFGGWQRSVVVEDVDPANPNTVVGSATGVRRVTVTVTYNGEEVTSVSTLRTDVVTPQPRDPEMPDGTFNETASEWIETEAEWAFEFGP